jgi:hypothetical protein
VVDLDVDEDDVDQLVFECRAKSEEVEESEENCQKNLSVRRYYHYPDCR